MSSPPRRTPSDLHTFATLDIPLAPRSQHKPSPIRFAAFMDTFQPISGQRRPSQCLLVRFAAPIDPFLPVSRQRRLSQHLLIRLAGHVHFLHCSRPPASARPRFAKPTATLSHPLRCTRRSIPACFRSAKPIPASSRPLRCTHRPIPTCFQAATPIPASSHPLRCIRRSVPACFQAATPIPASSRPLRYYGVRHCMKHREAPSRIRIFSCKSGNYRLSKAQRPQEKA